MEPPFHTRQNSTIQLEMARYANLVLCTPDSPFSSLVITHGTDTLEETAFFMDLTVNCRKPVIIVGAMRPATALSADGPANLYAAVKTGVFPDSKDRGALIVMNDRIGSAWYTQKTHGESRASALSKQDPVAEASDVECQSITWTLSRRPSLAT